MTDVSSQGVVEDVRDWILISRMERVSPRHGPLGDMAALSRGALLRIRILLQLVEEQGLASWRESSSGLREDVLAGAVGDYAYGGVDLITAQTCFRSAHSWLLELEGEAAHEPVPVPVRGRPEPVRRRIGNTRTSSRTSRRLRRRLEEAGAAQPTAAEALPPGEAAQEAAPAPAMTPTEEDDGLDC
jgi:hypothetical protein